MQAVVEIGIEWGVSRHESAAAGQEMLESVLEGVDSQVIRNFVDRRFPSPCDLRSGIAAKGACGDLVGVDGQRDRPEIGNVVRSLGPICRLFGNTRSLVGIGPCVKPLSGNQRQVVGLGAGGRWSTGLVTRWH